MAAEAAAKKRRELSSCVLAGGKGAGAADPHADEKARLRAEMAAGRGTAYNVMALVALKTCRACVLIRVSSSGVLLKRMYKSAVCFQTPRVFKTCIFKKCAFIT